MRFVAVCLAVFLLCGGGRALGVTNLVTNPGFLDLTPATTGSGSPFGDGWGFFANADANEFFGVGNPHASLFADTPGNNGGFFQQGIAGNPGTTFQFDLIDTRVEPNFDADLRFGIEFYQADDTTKVGETIVAADTATRIANGTLDGNTFSMQATAPAGTAFARPIVLFGPAPNPGSADEEQIFVFNTHLSEVPAPGGELLKNGGFEDLDGQGTPGDFWNNFGNAGFDDLFSGGGDPNAHASLFADQPNNSGGVFQQSVLGEAGATFEFSLLDVRIEENFDAELSFGLEFYGADNFTKVGESIELIDTNTGQVDGNFFVTSSTAPAGTVYVRPIVSFDNVDFGVNPQLSSVFIFDASLVQLPAESEPGDYNDDGFVSQGDLDLVLLNWGQAGDPPPSGWINQLPDSVISQNELDVRAA